MRAIIKCEAKPEIDALDSLLARCGWWPNLPQDGETVTSRRDEIVSHIASFDRDLAKETLKYTIYDETTRTWGIISAPAAHVLTFRLKNPVSDRLKAACEKLITDLLREVRDSVSKGGTTSIKFHPRIEILEPNSEDHAFAGWIVPPKRFWLAVSERKIEASIGAVTTVVAAFLLLATSPILWGDRLHGAAEPWHVWLGGNLERYSTAAAVTMTISWLQVTLHYLDIRRRTCVRWMLD